MNATGEAIDEMVKDCLAVRVRMIGRAVTAIYDRAVEPAGVTIAQVNLLAALGKAGPCTPSRLGAVLQLERSTVSRNLDRLLQAGWAQPVSTDAKGIRDVALTTAGRRKLESVLPRWRKAQQEAGELLGDKAVAAVRRVADGFWHAPGHSAPE